MSTHAASPEILRYPVGRFVAPAGFSQREKQAAIDTLAALPENLRSAVEGLSAAQLNTPYREGGWTVRQLVHHVADSHINAYVRTRLALTEDWPTVKAYDERVWAELHDAHTLPVDVSLDLLEPLHRRWVALFESLDDAAFARGYNHSENGPQKLSQVLPLYAWHCRHHTAHITELRKRMSWD
jgi:uncharacterized damage-inducible protein DinB